MFLGIAHHGLRIGDNRCLYLYIAFFGTALLAELFKIMASTGDIAEEPEEHVEPCSICRGVALCSVRPVKDIRDDEDPSDIY